MKRPISTYTMNAQEDGWERLIWVLSIAILLSAYYHFNAVPDTIPLHFNMRGEVDKWGSRNQVWLLPAIYMGLATLLFFLNKRPDIYNYSVKITEDNAQKVYAAGAHFMRMLRLWLAILFLTLLWVIFDAALRQSNSPWFFLIWISLGGLLISIAYGMYRFHIVAAK